MLLKKKPSTKSEKTSIRSAQHVVPLNGRWAVRKTGQLHPMSVHRTQAEALTAAKENARAHHSEVVVHSRDGRIKHRVSVSPADELMLRVWKSTHGAG